MESKIRLTPRGSPALKRSASIDKVKTNEAHELSNQSVFDGHERGAPACHGGEDAYGIARVAVYSSVLCPLETPMDRTQERDNLQFVSKFRSCLGSGKAYAGSITNLDGLEEVEQMCSGVL